MIPFQTPGYEELELSTQIVIAAALKRDLTVEVIDPATSFIRLSNKQKTEYIQQATCTSQDSYVTSLILGNKLVQKQLLREHKLSTPLETAFTETQAALQVALDDIRRASDLPPDEFGKLAA